MHRERKEQDEAAKAAKQTGAGDRDRPMAREPETPPEDHLKKHGDRLQSSVDAASRRD